VHEDAALKPHQRGGRDQLRAHPAGRGVHIAHRVGSATRRHVHRRTWDHGHRGPRQSLGGATVQGPLAWPCRDPDRASVRTM
jgi:hypothetical protein